MPHAELHEPIVRFWEWFLNHEDALYEFQSGNDPILHELRHELHKLNPALEFEFGSPVDGKREFIISAGGLTDVFPVVDLLAGAAPPLSRWMVTRFKPRKGFDLVFHVNDKELSAETVEVAFQRHGALVDIVVYVGDRRLPDKERALFGFLFLDAALGEFDVATKIGTIAFRPTTEKTHSRRYRLQEFVHMFDAINGTLH